MERKPTKARGMLKISNEVIIKISELAACEITGVATNENKLVAIDIPNSIVNRFLSPIRVHLSNEAVEIEVSIVVLQGYKAISVAEAVQSSIKSAVQNMTGIAVSKINVKITGIEIKYES